MTPIRTKMQLSTPTFKNNSRFFREHGQKWYPRAVPEETDPGVSIAEILKIDPYNLPIGIYIISRDLSPKTRPNGEFYTPKAFTLIEDPINLWRWIKSIPEASRVFYEVFSGYQKIHFDLDFSTDKFPHINREQAYTYLQLVLDAIQRVLHRSNVPYRFDQHCLVFNSHGPTKEGYKWSFHIIIRGFFHANNMESKAFYDEVRADINPIVNLGNSIDPGVYSRLQNFRLLGCQKIGSNRPKILDPITVWRPDGDGDLADMNLFLESLVGFTSGCTQIRPVATYKRIPHNKIDVSDAENANLFNLFLQHSETTPECFDIQSEQSGYIVLKRIKSGPCAICGPDKRHDGNGCYLRADSQKRGWFHCYRSQAYGIKRGIYLGSISDNASRQLPVVDEEVEDQDDIGGFYLGDYFVPAPGNLTGVPLTKNITTTDTIINNTLVGAVDITNRQRRVPATPITNNRLMMIKSDIPDHHCLKGTEPPTWDSIGNDDPYKYIKDVVNQVGGSVSHIEGQFEIPLDSDISDYHGSSDGATPTMFLDVNDGSIENRKDVVIHVGVAPSHIEGQFEIPTNATSIATFLNGNVKYIGGCEYSIKELYDSYERYRNGNGTKYIYERGHFSRSLTSLGHTVERKRFVKGGLQIPVVTLKRLDSNPNISPVEAVRKMQFFLENQDKNVLPDMLQQKTPIIHPRELDRHVDIPNFMNEYLEVDPNSTVDFENVYLCFKEYCNNKKISFIRFGYGRLKQYFKKWLTPFGSDDMERFIMKGFRCKQDKLDANNREKEARYRRIWEFNTIPYMIGYHNGRRKDRFIKTHLPEWNNISVYHRWDPVFPTIDELIHLSNPVRRLSERAQAVTDEVKLLYIRHLLNQEDHSERIRQLEDSIRDEVETAIRSSSWCIAARSTFGSGKTVNLLPYIRSQLERNPAFKVLFVLPRITLTDEFIAVYRELGFTVYSENDGNAEIRGDRVIVCYPSIHRVRGRYDLLVMDEYKCDSELQQTLVRKNNHEKSCHDAISQYISQTARVYIADALLDNGHVLEISKLRQDRVTVYQNMHPKHIGKKVYTVDNKDILVLMILKDLREGKIVTVPTNSKAFAEFLERRVKNEFPDLSMVVTTADNRSNAPVSELWRDKYLIVYTPTILAGNSFTDPVDVVYGYFTAESCDQADALQMMMRCRNNVSQEYYICVDKKVGKKIIPDDVPATFDAIKKYLLQRDAIMRMQSEKMPEEFRLPIDVIEFNRLDETIKASDPYFDSYVSFIKRNVVKQREYLFRMLLYMRDCGFSYGGNIHMITEMKAPVADIRQERLDFMKDRREQEIEAISNALDVMPEEYNEIAKKKIKTKQERMIEKKYRLRYHYQVDNVPKWFIRATKGKHGQHSRLERYSELNGIEDDNEWINIMGRISYHEMMKAKQEDSPIDIYDDVKDRERELNVHICCHALNILNIIGAKEFIRERWKFWVLKKDEIFDRLERYIEIYREQIKVLMLGGEKEDVIELASQITDKAFGIKIEEGMDEKEGKDPPLRIMVKNMWVYTHDRKMIWPFNIELEDREELRALPDYDVLNQRYQQRKHQEWSMKTIPMLKDWGNKVIQMYKKPTMTIPLDLPTPFKPIMLTPPFAVSNQQLIITPKDLGRHPKSTEVKPY
jgi:hypothetical protein